MVWKREYPLSKKATGFNAKFAPRYTGPLEVRRIISPVIVDLRDTRGRWHRHIHVQDLKQSPGNDPTEATLEKQPEDIGANTATTAWE